MNHTETESVIVSMNDLTELTENALTRLDIPPKLLGYRYLTHAVVQVVLDPPRITGLTKDLYPEIARTYGTDRLAVEGAVRTAVKACWKTRNGQEALERMTCRPIAQRPCASEFITIVAQQVKKSCLDQANPRRRMRAAERWVYNVPVRRNQQTRPVGELA